MGEGTSYCTKCGNTIPNMHYCPDCFPEKDYRVLQAQLAEAREEIDTWKLNIKIRDLQLKEKDAEIERLKKEVKDWQDSDASALEYGGKQREKRLAHSKTIIAQAEALTMALGALENHTDAAVRATALAAIKALQ